MQISARVPYGRLYRFLATASAALIVLSVVAMASFPLWIERVGPGTAGVVFALVFVIGVVGTTLVGSAARRAKVADMNPTAYVINLASLPGTGAEMRGLGKSFGIPVRMQWDYNMTLSVDATTVRFYRGLFQPKQVLVLPTSSLVRVGTNHWLTPAGTSAVERVEMEFETHDGRETVLFGFAVRNKVLHNGGLAQSLDELRTLAGLIGKDRAEA
jgi:hypothetical protein